LDAPFAALYGLEKIKSERKKREPTGSLLNTSSVRDAFDVGSPHAVFWTVCSPGACSTLLGWWPQLA